MENILSPPTDPTINISGTDDESNRQTLTTPKSSRSIGRPTKKPRGKEGGRPESSISVITDIFSDTTIQTPTTSRKSCATKNIRAMQNTGPSEQDNNHFNMVGTVGNKNLYFSLPDFAELANIDYPIPSITDFHSHLAYTIFTESSVLREEVQEMINAHSRPESNGLKHLSGQCIDLYAMWLKIILEQILPETQRIRVSIVKTSYAMNKAIHIFAHNC